MFVFAQLLKIVIFVIAQLLQKSPPTFSLWNNALRLHAAAWAADDAVDVDEDDDDDDYDDDDDDDDGDDDDDDEDDDDDGDGDDDDDGDDD